jgi:pSer/pThr/pTyr-binding forkhead associated (FHA) protein
MVGYNAALEIVDGPDKDKPLYTLTKKKITLGRTGADLLLSDPTVSSSHATLSVDGGRFLLADNGSTNGTKINDVPLDATPRELQNGDRIALGRGQTVLVFHRYN